MNTPYSQHIFIYRTQYVSEKVKVDLALYWYEPTKTVQLQTPYVIPEARIRATNFIDILNSAMDLPLSEITRFTIQ
jgi:hypothetical protein